MKINELLALTESTIVLYVRNDEGADEVKDIIGEFNGKISKQKEDDGTLIFKITVSKKNLDDLYDELDNHHAVQSIYTDENGSLKDPFKN